MKETAVNERQHSMIILGVDTRPGVHQMGEVVLHFWKEEENNKKSQQRTANRT